MPEGIIHVLNNRRNRKVIAMEDWVTIQNLKRRNPKTGTREIAKLVGCSRNTVKAALKKEQYNGYSREEKINPDISQHSTGISQSILNLPLLVSGSTKDTKPPRGSRCSMTGLTIRL
jgi:IS30 family transposase